MKAVILGGKGKMGRLFAKILSTLDYEVNILDQEDWENAKLILDSANLVLISVPIDVTPLVIEKICLYIKKSTLLMDITSIKEIPLRAMLQHHTGAVLALHPMFGPNVLFKNNKLASPSFFIIVNCGGRYEENFQSIVSTFLGMGFQIKNISASKHDLLTSYIQGLHYFNVFTEALYLYEQNNKSEFNSSIFESPTKVEPCSLSLDEFSSNAFNELGIMFLDTEKVNLYFGMIFFDQRRRVKYKEFFQIANDFLNEGNETSIRLALNCIIHYLDQYRVNEVFHPIKLTNFFQRIHFILTFFEVSLLEQSRVDLRDIRSISTKNYNQKLDWIFNSFRSEQIAEIISTLCDKRYILEFRKIVALAKQLLDIGSNQEQFTKTYLKIAPFIKRIYELGFPAEEKKDNIQLIAKL